MLPEISVPALLECVHRYYPVGLSEEDPRYESSPEIQHLNQRLHSAAKDTRAWSDFFQRVKESFPGCKVFERTRLPYGPSYQCQVDLPGQEPYLDRTREDSVICRLSVLAPVYALCAHHWKNDRTERESWTRYPPLPLEFQTHEEKLAAMVEATFGFARLPNEVLFTPVPDLRPPHGRFEHRAPWLVELLF
ncbi:hypothetical protein [Hyalangium versicolor]|uniref:hypothetical protein n=1 Tax=Hyalangium versicolor TaxID=2861190 RepID=UPI001CCBE441|nr:hypothetical protein [Hyalangium versicolor]